MDFRYIGLRAPWIWPAAPLADDPTGPLEHEIVLPNELEDPEERAASKPPPTLLGADDA